MAWFRCKNCYRNFEAYIYDVPITSDAICPACKSTWTEYLPEPPDEAAKLARNKKIRKRKETEKGAQGASQRDKNQ